MDIFNLKPKFEVPVIEERNHIGKGHKHTKETRRKMREAWKGRLSRKGRKHSEEHCRKISEAHRAKARDQYYGKHPKEWQELFGVDSTTVRYWKKNGTLLQNLQKRGYCLDETE